MDEKPKCSQDLEPVTQDPTKKTEEIESEYPKNNQPNKPATQIVLTKEQPAYAEDHSDAAKTLTTLTTDQRILSTDEPIITPVQPLISPENVSSPDPIIHSSEEAIFSTNLQVYLTEQPIVLTDLPDPSQPPIVSKEQPAYSTDQSPYSKTQPISTIDQPVLLGEKPINLNEIPEYSKDQAVCSEDHSTVPKTQTVLKKNESEYSTGVCLFSREKPSYSKDQSDYPKIQNVSTTDHRVFLKEQIDNSTEKFLNLIDQFDLTQKPTYSKFLPAACSNDQSAFSRKHDSPEEQKSDLRTIHIDSAMPVPSSSKELLNPPRIVEAASTKYVSVFPKNDIAKLIGNSINIEYGISLCTAREAAATSSYNLMNNGYFLRANTPLKMNTSTQSPSLPNPRSLMSMPPSVTVAVGTQPASLFLQALSKLNESSLTLAVISPFRLQSPSNLSRSYTFMSGDITPPDSLTSAPPTYSFVLRQIAGRRRPRFMGSFFPSPSFVQHTPPPTYTGAFDVYVEPPLPPPPVRTYSLGYNSMPVICPECGYTGMTVIKAHVTVCTHCCAFLLCILCCWICAPLPYLLTSCKDVYHYCRNCRSFLGMYCPSNPDATSIYPTDLNR
ncbi:hypothetical protein PYW08_012202 [Mythimna loreyi]|uniref:Uncharacterized protein n=1 Tax=Mythimna loreyi TaxID=667449 RepID=A0ACC2Q1D4_9NEOP|nr:hypothetical protein PYW08_012202 [Mythimna loreyi]